MTSPRTVVSNAMRVLLACAVVLVGLAGSAAAQTPRRPPARTPPAPRVPGPPRFDLTLGGGLVGGRSLGVADANLRANATTLQDYKLFSTVTTLGPAPALNLRVAGIVSRRVAIEGQILFTKSKLETAISGDAEAAPDVTLSESLTESFFGGGVRIRLDNLRPPSRVRPFVSAGAGILRRANDGSTSTEDGPFYYVGGGLQYALGVRPGGMVRQGVRADVQALLAKAPFSQDDALKPRFSVTGGFFFTF